MDYVGVENHEAVLEVILKMAPNGLPRHKGLEEGNKLLLPKLHPPPKNLDRTASEVAAMHRLNLLGS